MTTITLAIQWRGHQPGDTITVDQATAEWLRRTGATAPDPALSNREHARRTGASDPTVGVVRREMEERGEVQKFSTSRGADGKTYPASQPPRPEPEPEPESDPASAPEAPAKTSERPRKAAPVATWRAYAEAHGIDPKGLTKAEIIAATKGA